MFEKYLNERGLGRFQKGKSSAIFSINCFGYGEDHDSKLMKEIAALKDGNFYYIESLPVVRNCFLDALGGLASIICEDVKIAIELHVEETRISNIEILKTYGSQWTIPGELGNKLLARSKRVINIGHLLSGTRRDFVFLIRIPAQIPIAEGPVIVSASLKAKKLLGKSEFFEKFEKIFVEAVDERKFTYNEEKDPEVVVQRLRVETAEAIEKSIEYYDRKEYKLGDQALGNILKTLKEVEGLTEDQKNSISTLSDHVKKCEEDSRDKNRYEKTGRNQMNELQAMHMNQTSSYQHRGYTNLIQARYQKK